MSEVSQGQFVQDKFVNEDSGNVITEAVVFTDQAYLRRQAQVQAEKGLNRFLMEVQAFAVDVNSAQAVVYGDGEILSVQYKEIPVKDAPQEEVRELDLKKEQLERERKALQSEGEVQDKQLRFLDSVIGFAQDEMPKEVKTRFPKTEDLRTMLEFLGQNYQRLVEKKTGLEHKIEDLDDEISILEKKLKKSRRPKEATRKAIEVLFESRQVQEIGLEVTYVAQNASWEPVYKVDVPIDVSSVKLTMFARILQNTGENWRDVGLAVSNAIPLRGAALPDLESWYLSLRPKDVPWVAGPVPLEEAAPMARKAKGRRLKMEEEAGAEEEMETLDLAVAAPLAEFIQAEQRALPLAFEYALPQRVNMDSGSGETMLPLYTKEMQGEFFIYAVPKNDLLAYLVCRTSSDSELLAGTLNVHFGGRFVGGTALSEKKAGEDLLFNLGAERALKVRREKVTDKLTETFFGVVDRLSSARELEYRIVTENLKDEDARVRLLDGIPVSKTDRIQIKGVETTPAPTIKDYQNREGVMLWDFQMKPKAVHDIRIKFFVKHPKDNPPEGL